MAAILSRPQWVNMLHKGTSRRIKTSATWAVTTCPFNTLRPRQNGCHFADDIFSCIFVNENIWVPIKISLKFVPKGSLNNIPALAQIMAWRRPGNKPLSEPMMVSLLTQICVTWLQWVSEVRLANYYSMWQVNWFCIWFNLYHARPRLF